MLFSRVDCVWTKDTIRPHRIDGCLSVYIGDPRDPVSVQEMIDCEIEKNRSDCNGE